MPDERIRTVVAILVEPMAHKKQKLRRLQSTYREALQDAVQAGATTMTAVNDIVTPYDLPYQAKDALKRHIPQLLKDGMPDIDAAQPVRFTNRAATFDHSAEPTHEFCWAVPQPGRGTDIWIPLAINPAQRDWWDQLLAGDATAGQLQLVHQPPHDRWELHVPLTLPTPDTEVDQDACTPVGFDVGEAILLTGCALRNGRPIDPLLVDGVGPASCTRRYRRRSSGCRSVTLPRGVSTGKQRISGTPSTTRLRRRRAGPSTTPPASSSR